MSATDGAKRGFDWGHALRIVIAVVALVIFDQLVKGASRNLAAGVEGRVIKDLWPGVFELKLVFNKGVAFGMMQGRGVFLTPIALAISGFALFTACTKPKEGLLLYVTMITLAAGALGNLYDRLVYGQVTDMFYARFINFPVFNVADVSITIAGILLCWTGLKELLPSRATQAEQPNESDQDGDGNLAHSTDV